MEKFDKEKTIESMGCQEGGMGKVEPNKIIESMGCQEGKGVEKEIIESMGCQERGGGKFLRKRKSLKAWVAKKGRKTFDKKKIIESMGWPEGGGGGKNC